jgi:spore germination protein YaaH
MIPSRGALLRTACLVLCATTLACTSRTGGPVQLGGWITYWDFAQGVDLVTRRSDALSDVLFFIVQLDANGAPILVNTTLSYEHAVAQVNAKQGRSWMTVVNDVAFAGSATALKDPQIVHAVLSSDALRAAHRREIVRLALHYGFAGVDIDYENLWAADRDLFTVFIRELAADLRARGLLLSVTVQPKRHDSRSDGPGAADWARLCEVADRLQIMLYNLHSRMTGPGPMATGPWMRGVLRYAEQECDRQRVVPVVKVSGMRWGAGEVESVQYDQAMALVQRYQVPILRDPEGQVPYFNYDVDGKRHTVYYEDAVSLRAKLLVLQSLGYRSILFWSLGRQDPSLFPPTTPLEGSEIQNR